MNKDFRPVARSLFLTNILNLVKIDKLVVPELIEVSSTDLILDCQYTVPDGHFTLQWLLNNASVYQWSPPAKPKVNGVLYGRLDLTYKASNKVEEGHRALRIINLSPELNGNYTCIIDSHGVAAHETKPLLIYSLENEFDLITEWNNNSDIDVSCIVRGVYPRPDLTIEFNDMMVSGQRQRVWRNDGWFYDSTCQARIKGQSVLDKSVAVCRLDLPGVDYTAIKKKMISSSSDGGADHVSRGKMWRSGTTLYIISLNFFLLFNTRCFNNIGTER